MMEIWVYCGLSGGTLESETPMLLAQAQALGGHITAVIIGDASFPLEHVQGSDRVLFCKAAGRAWRKGEILTRMLREAMPDIVLFPATSESSQVAAHAAVSLETGLCADCTQLRIEDGQFIMHRPAFGGGVEADILCPEHRPQMATVRPGVFSTVSLEKRVAELVEYPVPPLPQDPVELVSSLCLPSSKNLQSAQIIVAGGLGVGSAEGFALLQKLADALGGQVGATRAAVDAGFASWKQQIGQTGLMVHPKLYLAFGISGAIQHIAGMHGADTIISVNTDPRAPIFAYSDYTVIADWKETAGFLIEKITKNAKNG